MRINRIKHFLALTIPCVTMMVGSAVGGRRTYASGQEPVRYFEARVDSAPDLSGAHVRGDASLKDRMHMSAMEQDAYLRARYEAHDSLETRADTAYAIFGHLGDDNLHAWMGSQAGSMHVVGLYDKNTDDVEINAHEFSDSVMDHAFVHELVHRVQARYGTSIDEWFRREGIIPDGGTYGALVMSEQHAEATAYAFDFLQSTAGGTIDSVRASVILRQLDGTVPGTRTMVERLLAFPVYQHHPLATGVMKIDPAIQIEPLPWPVAELPVGDSVSRARELDGFTLYKVALAADSATMHASVDSTKKVMMVLSGEYPSIKSAMIRMIDLYDLDRGWRGHPARRVKGI